MSRWSGRRKRASMAPARLASLRESKYRSCQRRRLSVSRIMARVTEYSMMPNSAMNASEKIAAETVNQRNVVLCQWSGQ
ncbi:hypothetical protein [Paraburkholderia sp. BR14262]|uniref:hypothetical protein n=1 Tax=Paraburkholderia sp. BR14262 TaxID=3236999 RepID=UPI0034D00DC8